MTFTIPTSSITVINKWSFSKEGQYRSAGVKI